MLTDLEAGGTEGLERIFPPDDDALRGPGSRLPLTPSAGLAPWRDDPIWSALFERSYSFITSLCFSNNFQSWAFC